MHPTQPFPSPHRSAALKLLLHLLTHKRLLLHRRLLHHLHIFLLSRRWVWHGVMSILAILHVHCVVRLMVVTPRIFACTVLQKLRDQFQDVLHWLVHQPQAVVHFGILPWDERWLDFSFCEYVPIPSRIQSTEDGRRQVFTDGSASYVFVLHRGAWLIAGGYRGNLGECPCSRFATGLMCIRTAQRLKLCILSLHDALGHSLVLGTCLGTADETWNLCPCA